MRRLRIRIFLKRMMNIALLIGLSSLFPACSVNPPSQTLILQDLNRIRHAQELLPGIYKKVGLKRFEGDFKIVDYIEKYIQKENPQLDAKLLTETLLKVSHDYGYDPVFLLAVIQTETRFNPNLIGAAGELGLMQIKPSTAEWICKKRKVKWLGAEHLKDPAYNVLVGAHYFHYLKTTLDSESHRYINAYNMGINNLQRLPASEQKKRTYYAKVISNYLDIYATFRKYRSLI